MIVGTGLVGAVIARTFLQAGASVVMLDGGSPVSTVLGGHVRNTFACQTDRGYYHDCVRAHLRAASVPAPLQPLVPHLPTQLPASSAVNPRQRPNLNVPAAALTNIVGGMSALWRCIAVRFNTELERSALLSTDEWERLYRVAEEVLAVGSDLNESSVRQAAILSALRARYRKLGPPSPVPAPLAARRAPQSAGLIRWTAPAEVLEDVAPDVRTSHLDVQPQHVARRLLHRRGRVSGVEVLCLETQQITTIKADVFIVAGGAIRTPALLWESGVCPDRDHSAVGKFLCDHPVAYGQIALNAEIFESILAGLYSGVVDELPQDPDAYVHVPVSGARPFHSLMLSDAVNPSTLACRVDESCIVSLYWYAMMRPRHENRVIFHEAFRDSYGLPRPTFEFSLCDDDQAAIKIALRDMTETADVLGTFLPTAPPQVLAYGSSMHLLGTTRMGAADDGSSVVDEFGRVWGISNLFLGGTGLIPDASASSPTLTACALAIRTAEHVCRTRREVPDVLTHTE